MSTPAIRAIASALPLLVLGVRADDHHGAVAPDDLAVVAPRLDGRSDLHGFLDYFSRYVMRPRVRSYGDSSTRTRSPGRIRMKFIRSLPLMWASTRWPFSSSTANIVFGSGSMTVPSTSIASFLATGWSASLSHAECRPGRADTRTRSVSKSAIPGKYDRRTTTAVIRSSRSREPRTERPRDSVRSSVRHPPSSDPSCPPSDGRQDLGPLLGNRDRMLEVSSQRAIDGRDCPIVVEHVRAIVAQREHRLDGQAESRLDLAAPPAGAVVRDLWLLVHLGADAMADELPDDAEPMWPRDIFHRRRDVLDVIARDRCSDTGHHRLARHVDQGLDTLRWLADEEGS